MQTNINPVQFFIRVMVGIISFGCIGIFLWALLGNILPFWALALFNFWFSSIIAKMFYILPEWQRMVLLRLGRFQAVKGPGFFVIPPFIYSVASIIDKRIEIYNVEATNTLTKDNVPIKVTAAVEFQVSDPQKAIIDVKNYRQSVVWLTTEALKNTIGNMDLRRFLSEREEISSSLKVQIDDGCSVYGVDVIAVRITDVDTPSDLVQELAVIARAERSAKAKKIEAEAEIEVAQKLAVASEILDKQKGGMRLRELEVLNEMSKEESSMIIVYPYGDRGGERIASAAAGAIGKEEK